MIFSDFEWISRLFLPSTIFGTICKIHSEEVESDTLYAGRNIKRSVTVENVVAHVAMRFSLNIKVSHSMYSYTRPFEFKA